MAEENAQGQKSTVKDKRAYNSDEKIKEAGNKEPGKKEEEGQKNNDPVLLPEVDFSTFILSLSSSVLLHLGEIADPQTGKKRRDIALAKQSIDIISMLSEKTKGNLADDETKLLDNLLSDARLRFVKARGLQ